MLILGPSLRESMKDIIDIFFNVKRADICKRFGYFNKLNESVYTYLYFLCVIKPKNIQMLDFVILIITHNTNFLSQLFYCVTQEWTHLFYSPITAIQTIKDFQIIRTI